MQTFSPKYLYRFQTFFQKHVDFHYFSLSISFFFRSASILATFNEHPLCYILYVRFSSRFELITKTVLVRPDLALTTPPSAVTRQVTGNMAANNISPKALSARKDRTTSCFFFHNVLPRGTRFKFTAIFNRLLREPVCHQTFSNSALSRMITSKSCYWLY